VPSTHDRQLARARAARQAQRARERNRRRRVIAGITAGALLLAGTGVGIAFAVTSGSKNDKSSVTAIAPSAAAPRASATAAAVACNGPTEPLAPATRTFAAEPKLTINTAARYTMTIDTSCGPITVALEAAKAPHTVNLLSFLAADHFYDGTKCHRSTDVPALSVLQCGDPTGTGSGEIGFTIGEENLKGATYPRGTLAMAKTSAAHSTGSQFFLVDKDSQLPPQYTVVGHISLGLSVLDRLIAIGNNSKNGQGDGAPNKTIYLQKVTVTKS
jgi:peptidyl-prolyl cis-trans isomerase B (cyclophilin B)